MKTFSLVMLLSIPLTGCILYSDDDDPCLDYGGAGADIAYFEVRNPESGACVQSGGGGGGGGNCGAGYERPADPVDWAICNASCETLAEDTCLETPGCRGAYIQDFDCVGDGCLPPVFYQCWGTAPSGPVQGGDCTVLSAYECSRHDDCIAIHDSVEVSGGAGLMQAIGGFWACGPEGEDPSPVGCFEGDVCGGGYVCNAAEVCLPPPGCGATPSGEGLQDPVPCETCYGYCVPPTQGPGSCVGEVSCDEGPPECPFDTVPGINGTYWTGYCIPLAECDVVPECEGLTETLCTNRSDCAPIYQGIDCTCDGDACTCADWLYTSCETTSDPV